MSALHFTPKLFSLLKQGYNFTTLKDDILAGLTVAIVALPLAMALGIASGASPEQGLITAVIAGFFISLLGGSRVQIGGPTGAFIVVVFGIIQEHGYNGLILATLLAGFMLIIAGYSKLGRVIKYIPYPVITGFTAGIAVIIASSQVQPFLGLEIPQNHAEFVLKWQNIFTYFHTLHPSAIFVGIGSLGMIMFLKHYLPKWPGYLLAVVLASCTVFLLQLPVETIGSKFPISGDITIPPLPVWHLEQFMAIVPSAFTIAFLAGIESLLSATVADGMTGYKHRPNQELVAQGVANIASAFVGGLPATGAIARTATNIKSGGKTPLAGIFHAVFLLLFILFCLNLMAYVPLAALSAILFVVAWNMSEYRHFTHIFRLSKTDRIVMLLTFILTVMVDLTVAIAVGVTLASLLFMREMSMAVAVKSQGRKTRDNITEEIHQRDDLPEGVEVFRITGPIFFGMTNSLLEVLQTINGMPKVLIIRMKLVPYIDVAGLLALENMIRSCHEFGCKVILTGLQPQPKGMLMKDGVVDNHQNLLFHDYYDEAIAMAHQLLETPEN